MRDIKFRAWCKASKHMKNVISLDFINKKAYIGVDKEGRPVNYIHLKACELMQYTGICDNTDEEKEIYEGDKVVFNYKDVEHIGEVKFEAGAFVLCNYELPDSYITLLDIANCDDGYFWIDGEVVGNIYEH